jgi:hypothetical protein
LSPSTFSDCCHFLNVTIEDANVLPHQSLWPAHTQYMTSNKYQNDPWLNSNCSQARLILEDFQFAQFSRKHISFTWQPQKSL